MRPLQLGKRSSVVIGGEEPQPAQIHRQQRNGAVTHGARGRKQRAIAAQHDGQIAAIRHMLPVEPHQHARIARRFVVEARFNSVVREPAQQLRHQLGGARRIGFGEDADGFNGGHKQELPVAFGAGDRAFHDIRCETPLFQKSRTLAQTTACSAGSRTIPPFPTWPLPTSNCGFTSTISLPVSGFSTRTMAGMISVAEMKLTSQTARSTGSPRSAGSRYRALMPSCTHDARIVAQFPVELPRARRRWRERAPRRPAAGNP